MTSLVEIFDEKTIQNLKFYVYCLIDPRNNRPFYIGKGKENRIFAHINEAIENPSEEEKLETIRDIKLNNQKVEHIIVRHGLTESESLEIEASLIDVIYFFGHDLTNKVKGHHSIDKGLMKANELIAIYNADPLEKIENDAVIININRLYKRGSGYEGIYNAVRECWPIGKFKRETIKYVLTEYRGYIVEVFEVEKWYPVNDVYKSGGKKGQTRIRWGFVGEQAQEMTRNKYINKSISHHKKRGAANPIRYNL